MRFSADEISAATSDDLRRLRAAADDPVDTSEIPEWTGEGTPAARDDRGRLVRHPIGEIGRAILRELDRKRMTRYRLWQDARSYCPTLSESAVYGFLGGVRQIEVPYVEALLRAAGLVVGPGKAKPKAITKGLASGAVVKKTEAAKATKAPKVKKAAPAAKKGASAIKGATPKKKGASAAATKGVMAKKASKKSLA